MKILKASPVYLVFALLVVGCFGYCAFYGVAFWESGKVIRDAGPNANRTRGVHTFYHK